jgi:hypothetical protein
MSDIDTFRRPRQPGERYGTSTVPTPTRGHRLACAEWIYNRVMVDLADEWPLGPRGLMYEATRDPNLINAETGKRYTKQDLASSGSLHWDRLVGDLRRLGLIPWEAIADSRSKWSWTGTGIHDIEDTAKGFVRQIKSSQWSRRIGQESWVNIVVEAVGEVPALRKACGDLPIEWLSGQGFLPIPAKRDLALSAVARWHEDDQRTVVGHIGDHDPAGVEQFTNMREDVSQFIIDAYGYDPEDIIVFERITLRPEHVDEYIDPSARNPVNQSKRWWPEAWGGTAEFEDLDRDQRRDLLLEWVDSIVDMDKVQALRDDDAPMRERLADEVRQHFQTG